ncbi:MAG: hypothetical protein C6W54_04785 [Bacillaceae bacterium]|nr:MAG: hypothetical protein C6W54_04785 [Bacillaceae bacterium]
MARIKEEAVSKKPFEAAFVCILHFPKHTVSVESTYHSFIAATEKILKVQRFCKNHVDDFFARL